MLSGFRYNFLLNSLEKVGDHLRKRPIVMHLIFFFLMRVGSNKVSLILTSGYLLIHPTNIEDVFCEYQLTRICRGRKGVKLEEYNQIQ